MTQDDEELILIRGDGVRLRPSPDVWTRCDTLVMELAASRGVPVRELLE
jgi:hypothetical protein